MAQKKICIAPLDWGLGHATRCIELINVLIELDYIVYIASEGKQEKLLQQAIPSAIFLPLKGYRIRYAKKSIFLHPILLLQIPKIIVSIINEYYWLKKTAKEIDFDLIIADNRYGFFHKKIKSVFITHQLAIQTGFKWSNYLMQKINYAFINQFNGYWIPDMLPPINLAGKLSNPSKFPKGTSWYMNCLSRLKNSPNVRLKTKAKAITFLAIISGPEPQRTLLEHLIWQQGNTLHLPFVIVAGLPDKEQYEKSTQHGNLYAHLSGDELVAQIQNAEYILCRGGYTTLMELIPFKKKLILIPTPGQTEQTYLANYWFEKKWAIFFEQEHFNLQNALLTASQFEFKSPPYLSFDPMALASELKRLSLSYGRS